MPNDDGWMEYKNLVIKELERNDGNIQKVLEGVQSVGTEIASIKTSIDSIKETMVNQQTKEKELSIRINALEKNFASLKTRVIMMGFFAAAIASTAISAIIKFL